MVETSERIEGLKKPELDLLADIDEFLSKYLPPEPDEEWSKTEPAKHEYLQDVYPLIMAALCLWRESRGESREGKEGVWAVIWNRLKSGKWGGNLVAVVTATKQFSCFNRSDPQVTLYPSPTDNRWLECLDIVSKDPPDLLDGAMFYFNPIIVTPEWSKHMKLVKRIEHHDFYKG